MHGPMNVKLAIIRIILQEIILRFLSVTGVVIYVFREVRN